MQRARAVHGDVAGPRRQRDPRQVEALDAERRDVGPVRTGDRAELAVLPAGAGHGDPDGEPAAAATVAAERAVLVPAHVGRAFDHADLLQQAFGGVAHVGVTQKRKEWAVSAGHLHVAFELGRRTPLGWLLRAIPAPLCRSRLWVRAIDWPARTLLPGVRTVGSAGNGRREYYGARDLQPIVASTAWADGQDLGPLAKVDPPVRFGFGSVPPNPGLVRVTTTVDGVS